MEKTAFAKEPCVHVDFVALVVFAAWRFSISEPNNQINAVVIHLVQHSGICNSSLDMQTPPLASIIHSCHPPLNRKWAEYCILNRHVHANLANLKPLPACVQKKSGPSRLFHWKSLMAKSRLWTQFSKRTLTLVILKVNDYYKFCSTRFGFCMCFLKKKE